MPSRDLQAKIRSAVDADGRSIRAIAQAAGLRRATLSDLYHGHTDGIRWTTWRALASVLDLSCDDSNKTPA
jgi:lambda repressor-like predicted transcriptional regulator